MPEVAGDAALLVNPVSITDIATAMKKLAADERLRAELISKGKVQLQKFSWQLTGEKLWRCCEVVLKGKGSKMT